MKLKSTIFRGFVVIAIIPLMLLSLFVYVYTKNMLENDIRKDMEIVSKNTSNKISRYLFERMKDIQTWNSLYIDVQRNNQRCRDSLRIINKQNSIYSTIVNIDQNNEIIFSTNGKIPQNSKAEFDIIKMLGKFRMAKEMTQTYYSEMFYSSYLNNNVIAFVSINRQQNNNLKILAGYLDAMFIYQIVENEIEISKLQEDNGFIAVYNDEGIVFLAPEFQRKDIYLRMKTLVGSMRNELARSEEHELLNNVYLVNSIDLEQFILDDNNIWRVAVFKDKEIAFRCVYLLRNFLVLLSTLVVLISTFVSSYLSVSISKPIHAVSELILKVSKDI